MSKVVIEALSKREDQKKKVISTGMSEEPLGPSSAKKNQLSKMSSSLKYWKVSLFRTTTGEKFEIRYINVVRGEQEWLLKIYTLPTR